MIYAISKARLNVFVLVKPQISEYRLEEREFLFFFYSSNRVEFQTLQMDHQSTKTSVKKTTYKIHSVRYVNRWSENRNCFESYSSVVALRPNLVCHSSLNLFDSSIASLYVLITHSHLANIKPVAKSAVHRFPPSDNAASIRKVHKSNMMPTNQSLIHYNIENMSHLFQLVLFVSCFFFWSSLNFRICSWNLNTGRD